MLQVVIHPLVFQEDFKKIPQIHQQKIIKALRKKLSHDPKAFGKPLTGPLKGYWRLRVDDYRVIYLLQDSEVIIRVIKVGIRRDSEVYEEMLRRIPKILTF